MRLSERQHKTLETYFEELGLDKMKRLRLFDVIERGWTKPFVVYGKKISGKDTLVRVLRYFGVNAYADNEVRGVELEIALKNRNPNKFNELVSMLESDQRC